MSVKSVYNKWAKYYDNDKDTEFLFELERKSVLDLLDIESGETVLDIGCGTGKYLPYLKRKTKSITACDLSDKMLEIIKFKYPKIKTVQADLTKKLPFKSNSFDKIVCTQTLKHIKNLGPVFKELKRILKSDGECVFSVIHPEADRTGFDLRKKNTFECNEECFITRHSLTQILDAVEYAKLDIDGMKQYCIDDNVKDLLTVKSYKSMKGKALVLVVKVEK